MVNTLLGEVTVYIEKNTTVYAKPIYKTAWGTTATEQVMARIDPSQYADQRYLDGSRIGKVNLSFYAKSKNQITATDQLDRILSILDISSQIELTGGLFIYCAGVTLPVYVSKDESLSFIFSCSVALEFHAAA